MENSLDRLVLDVDQALSANFSASNIILGGISGLSYSYVLSIHLLTISKTDGSNFNASTVDDVIASNGVKATSNSNMVRTHAISFVDAAGNTSASAIATWGEMVKINLNDVYASLGGFVINVELGGDISGGSVSNAGDVNDDEYADLLLGALDHAVAFARLRANHLACARHPEALLHGRLVLHLGHFATFRVYIHGLSVLKAHKTRSMQNRHGMPCRAV